VRSRVEHLAPFLSFDGDPYATIIDGHIKWIIDGYTTTSKFPNAQRADTSSLPDSSGLHGNFNYVRNSVKAVVDAYDGTTTFYVVDNKDPLLKAYRSAFPKLFTDSSKVPDELRVHFRYPEDLFRVQTNMWGRYHIDNADDFYNQNDAWTVAQEPSTPSAATTPTTTSGGQTTTVTTASDRIAPYYLLMRLPGEEKESFLLLRPFVPASGDTKKQLTAFMIAKSDPDNYGQLETFVMPRSNLPDGPGIAAGTMQQDEAVSQLETLLGQAGSDLVYGNLILVPIENSLLYVRPVYTVASRGAQVPSLKKVIVEFNGRVAVEDTLKDALGDLFGATPETGESQPGTGTGTNTPPLPTSQSVADLLKKAAQSWADADTALKNGDLGTYQRKEKEGRDYVQQAQEQAATESKSTSSSTATSTTSTTSGTA
jgi:hypothetical protein